MVRLLEQLSSYTYAIFGLTLFDASTAGRGQLLEVWSMSNEFWLQPAGQIGPHTPVDTSWETWGNSYCITLNKIMTKFEVNSQHYAYTASPWMRTHFGTAVEYQGFHCGTCDCRDFLTWRCLPSPFLATSTLHRYNHTFGMSTERDTFSRMPSDCRMILELHLA